MKVHFVPDALDDLLGRVGTSDDNHLAPGHAPEDYDNGEEEEGHSEALHTLPPVTQHVEPCPKCRGTGRYGSYSRHGQHCFKCKGTGKLTFKSSLQQWGGLTEGQLAAVQRCVARDAEKAARQEAERLARMERDAAAPKVDTSGVDRLKASFDTAVKNARAKGFGLKWPRITIAEIVITPAKPDSRNPGALYVKARGQYLGKIVEGRLHASRDCSSEQEKRILAFLADPEAAAKAYGLETGVCCICNATLTSKWRFRGIGPICAQKFGWAGEEE
jgi:hypothetical protein